MAGKGHEEPAAEARTRVCNGVGSRNRRPTSRHAPRRAARMAKSAGETSHWPEYDYVIVSSDIEDSVGLVQAIVTRGPAQRGKPVRMARISDRRITTALDCLGGASSRVLAAPHAARRGAVFCRPWSALS